MSNLSIFGLFVPTFHLGHKMKRFTYIILKLASLGKWYEETKNPAEAGFLVRGIGI